MVKRCELRSVRPVKKLKNGIIRVPDDSDYLSDVERASDGMSGGGEVRRVNRKRWGRGREERNGCSDGDVVGVGEGGGGGFWERWKRGWKVGGLGRMPL